MIWLAMNVLQVWHELLVSLVGFSRYFRIVFGDGGSNPRSIIWSYIISGHQIGLSACIFLISARISADTAGRPLRRLDSCRQYIRNSARYQPMTVSDFTTHRTSLHPANVFIRRTQIRRKFGVHRGLGVIFFFCWS